MTPSSPSPRLPDLLVVQPRWVTLEGQFTDPADEQARVMRTVTLLDEAVALGAPFEEFGLQVGVGTRLGEVDDAGQPTADEKVRLRAFQGALVQALADQGRLVAVLTVDGVREHVAYVRSVEVLESWREGPPAGMDTHDWQVQVLEDPSWLGLREIAGLLQDGERDLPALVELAGPPQPADDLPLPPHEQGRPG